MSYTKAQRRMIYDALVGASTRLWNGHGGIRQKRLKNQFICQAVQAHTTGLLAGLTRIRDRQRAFRMANLANNMISDRLADCSFISSSVYYWLRYVIKVPKKQLTKKNVQEYRRLWLADMIKEFSK